MTLLRSVAQLSDSQTLKILRIVAQRRSGQADGFFFVVDTSADEVVGQDLRQDAAVGVELGQAELQLVGVAVVAELLGFGHRLQACPICSMEAGTFEYHQWPLVTTLGKIQL